MMTTSRHFLLHQCHTEAWHLSLPGFPLVTRPPQFIPKSVSCLRMGFMGPRNSPQVLFESALHGIWHVLRLCRNNHLRAKFLYLAWLNYSGLYRDIISRHPPHLPRQDSSLPFCYLSRLDSQQPGNRCLPCSMTETLESFDNIVQLGEQLAMAANNLGVLGVLASSQPHAPKTPL